MMRAIALAAVAAGVVFLASSATFAQGAAPKAAAAGPQTVAPPAAGSQTARPAADALTCGTKKTCDEMTSCEEAMFYVKQCGLAKLDGNKDGVPCENVCRDERKAKPATRPAPPATAPVSPPTPAPGRP